MRKPFWKTSLLPLRPSRDTKQRKQGSTEPLSRGQKKCRPKLQSVFTRSFSVHGLRVAQNAPRKRFTILIIHSKVFDDQPSPRCTFFSSFLLFSVSVITSPSTHRVA